MEPITFLVWPASDPDGIEYQFSFFPQSLPHSIAKYGTRFLERQYFLISRLEFLLCFPKEKMNS
jgi:hypothetical protein